MGGNPIKEFPPIQEGTNSIKLERDCETAGDDRSPLHRNDIRAENRFFSLFVSEPTKLPKSQKPPQLKRQRGDFFGIGWCKKSRHSCLLCCKKRSGHRMRVITPDAPL